MANRYQLDIVQRDEEIIRFTLVIDDPFGYFVEQLHEPVQPFAKARIHRIQREELLKYWVNDIPLIKLVERKLEELATKEILLSAA